MAKFNLVTGGILLTWELIEAIDKDMTHRRYSAIEDAYFERTLVTRLLPNENWTAVGEIQHDFCATIRFCGFNGFNPFIVKFDYSRGKK